MVKKTAFLFLAGLHVLFLSSAFAASKSASFQVSCIVPQRIEVTASTPARASAPAQGFYQEDWRNAGGASSKLITVTA